MAQPLAWNEIVTQVEDPAADPVEPCTAGLVSLIQSIQVPLQSLPALWQICVSETSLRFYLIWAENLFRVVGDRL